MHGAGGADGPAGRRGGAHHPLGLRAGRGDLIFGDADGVVVVPQAVEAHVLALAFDKIKGEKRTLDDLRAGQKLGDVFAKYGIL